MPRKRANRDPTVEFHMKTRSRKVKAEPAPEPSKPATESSSLSEMDTPPSPPQNIPVSSSRKRKLSESDDDNTATLPAPKRQARHTIKPVAASARTKQGKTKFKSTKSKATKTSSSLEKQKATAATEASVEPEITANASEQDPNSTVADTAPVGSDSAAEPHPSLPVEDSPAEQQISVVEPDSTTAPQASLLVEESPVEQQTSVAEPVSTTEPQASLSTVVPPTEQQNLRAQPESATGPESSLPAVLPSTEQQSPCAEAEPDSAADQNAPPTTSAPLTTTLRRSARNAKPGDPVPTVTLIPKTTNPRKRKSPEDAPEDAQTTAKKSKTKKNNDDEKRLYDKNKELWPQFDRDNPIYYAADGVTQYQPGEHDLVEGDDTPESPSPEKSARGGGAGRGGRGGRGGGRGGKGKGKGRGKSPDPPEKRLPLTQDEKDMISTIKARQQELKRFFSVVGAQQAEILEQMVTRDLNRLAKKPNAHKKVPEYDEVLQDLEAAKNEAEAIARKRYEFELETELRRMEAEKEMIEQQFKTRAEGARREHLSGAEGDVVLFERAYRAAHDDTHTESASDGLEQLPHHHEMPEPDAQPRGYNSSKIMDEKAFKRPFDDTYDEQARQQVMNDEVIEPLLENLRHKNERYLTRPRGSPSLEQQRHPTQTMFALSEAATEELKKIEGYLIPRPLDMGEANSYGLSALADVAEYVAQRHPHQQYMYMPNAPGNTLPPEAVILGPLPGQGPPPPPPTQPAFQPAPPASSRPRGRRLKYPPLTYEQAVVQDQVVRDRARAASTLPPLQPQVPPTYTGRASLGPPPSIDSPRVISTGPGQPIAPAPPKPATQTPTRQNVNIFRHNTRYPPPPPPSQTTPTHSVHHSRHSSLSMASPIVASPQQYVFQTPQQPFQHQGVQPASTPSYTGHGGAPLSPVATGGPGQAFSAANGAQGAGAQQNKAMTFVNQTVASRNAAAAAAQNGGSAGGGNPGTGTGGGEKGVGKRVLLPKGA